MLDLLREKIREPNGNTVLTGALNDILVREAMGSQDVKQRTYVTRSRGSLIQAPAIESTARLNQPAHANEFVFFERSCHWATVIGRRCAKAGTARCSTLAEAYCRTFLRLLKKNHNEQTNDAP